MNKTKIYIVNHTHWDREWYKTKSQFLIHLKAGVEYLIKQLDEKNIQNFFFDGQTIIIEDLKEVLSDDNFHKFISYIKNGKIEIGPWYVLPDEGLLDQFGLEKNLEIGMEICNKLGVKSSGILYMPDTFGHNSKMPTIASKFGIKNAIIHRGLETSVVDCKWIDNQHSLNTIVLPTREGYYNTMFHQKDFMTVFEDYVNKFQKGKKSNDVLILNGCDHTFVPTNFKDKLQILRNKYKDKFIFEEVLLSEFFEKTSYKFSNEITGEFRKNSKVFLLPGVLSSRYYLKKDNQLISDLVHNEYERLSLELGLYENEKKNINSLYKQIVQNHPHDSICGCSVDSVHQEMEIRSLKVFDNANTSIFEMLNKKFYYQINELNEKIVFINYTNNKERIVDFKICIPKDKVDKAPKNIILKNNDKSFSVKITKVIEEEILVHDYKSEPTYMNVYTLSCVAILLLDNLINHFDFVLVKKELELKTDINDFIIKDNKIKLNDVEIDLAKYYYHTDAGDSYNIDKVGEMIEIPITSLKKKKSNSYSTYEIKNSIDVEDTISEDRLSRSGKMITLLITTKVLVCNKTKEVYLDVNINNKHENIRILKAYDNVNKVLSNTAGDLILREQCGDLTYNAKKEGEEILYNQHVTNTEIFVNDAYQISHIGNNEMEIIDNELLHTLFRGNNDLSRRDLNSRRGGAGPSYQVKGNQMIRNLDFKFKLTFTNNFLEEEHLNLYPIRIHQYTREINK